MDGNWFRNKKITVMGLGVHGGGLGAAKWLMRHGAAVTVTDIKDQHALADSIAELERSYLKEARRQGKKAVHRVRYALGRHDEADFRSAHMVIQNPGVPRHHPLIALAKKNRVPTETDISIFFMLCPFPILAVTGTKGKTTTTALIGEMCRLKDKRTIVAGNIRVSPLDALDKLLAPSEKRKSKPPPIVLELSSWQLEGLSPHRLSPHTAVVTNIMEDHLNRYRDMDDYEAAKKIIVKYQKAGDVAVLNADDRRVGKWKVQSGKLKVMRFSMRRRMKEGCFLVGKNIVINDGLIRKIVARLADVRLPGRHNISNVLAAAAAAYAAGIPVSLIRRAIRSFRGVPGRLQDVAVRDGVRFINDTTATTPDAAIAAMKTLGRGRNIILIAGGADKELRFDSWAGQVKRSVKHLILFDGAATVKMEEALSGARANVPMIGVRSMNEAVDEARRHAKSGDVILLSPGCASFGLFQHEFDRGDQFAAAVMSRRRRRDFSRAKHRVD